MDVLLVALTEPLWAPLMLLLATGIKLLSPGPALFRQDRMGLSGRPFVCLKFRTMRVGAETAAHQRHLAELIRSNRPMAKLDRSDPRLIPLAWLVRATGLDELPQLFNVLRGEMSLVGPRPCTLGEYSDFSARSPERFDVLPGLTGLWQVSGKNRTTFEEMIALDAQYVWTLSPPLDLAIILHTPVALLEQLVQSIRERMARKSFRKPALPRSGHA